MDNESDGQEPETVVATRGLVRGLLDIAARADPRKVTVDLSVTPGAEFPSAADVEDVPVFSHYYLPNVATSTSNVFGVNLTVPPGQTQGRFVSHPLAPPELSTKDSLHEVVFLSTPPWTRDDVRVFDRAGRRKRLRVIDAEPPQEPLP